METEIPENDVLAAFRNEADYDSPPPSDSLGCPPAEQEPEPADLFAANGTATPIVIRAPADVEAGVELAQRRMQERSRR